MYGLLRAVYHGQNTCQSGYFCAIIPLYMGFFKKKGANSGGVVPVLPMVFSLWVW